MPKNILPPGSHFGEPKQRTKMVVTARPQQVFINDNHDPAELVIDRSPESPLFSLDIFWVMVQSPILKRSHASHRLTNLYL